MAPTFEPELKMPVARARSFLGNHSATVLIAAGKFPASPTPSAARHQAASAVARCRCESRSCRSPRSAQNPARRPRGYGIRCRSRQDEMSRTLRRESKTSRLRHTGTSPGNLVFGKRHPMKDWRMAAGYVFPMPVPYQLTAYLVYPHGKKHTHRIDGKQQTHRTKLCPSRDKSSHDRGCTECPHKDWDSPLKGSPGRHYSRTQKTKESIKPSSLHVGPSQ